MITGDETLFKKFQKARRRPNAWTASRKNTSPRALEDQATRHAKFGNSACMQEPNIKNGCGGLRDFQNLLWMAFFKYRTRSLRELEEREFVSEAERKQLEAAYDFLLRARTELHYHINRPMDVLGKNLQPAVAHDLGYGDRSPSKRIEKFMRDLYTHMRNIFLITRTLEQRMALLPPAQSKLSLRAWLPKRRRAPEPVDGFLFVDGEIRAASSRIFRDQPRRLMRVFLHAQQRRLTVASRPGAAHPQPAFAGGPRISERRARARNVSDHPRTARQRRARSARHARGESARQIHSRIRQADLPGAARVLSSIRRRRTHAGLPGATGPDLGGQGAAVQKLRAAVPEPGAARPALSGAAAARCRQGGDATNGGHPEVSAEMAMRAAKRLRLDGAAAHTLRLIIENHLLMASVSQRRDLDDPAVIRNFARQIETPETLNLLTLLTFADSQGTSDKLWNGFKDSLLWQLHSRAMVLLTGGTEFIRAAEKQREALLQEVRELAPTEIERRGNRRPFCHAAAALFSNPHRPGNPR